MKYLQIHKFLFKNVISLTIEYKMYLKILQKLRCLAALPTAFQNRPSGLTGRDEDFVNFELLERQFCKEKLCFVYLKKIQHSFKPYLPIYVF